MRRLILILLFSIFLVGCTNSDATINTLEKSGYTDITTGGYDFLGCGQDDLSSTKFEAINPSGQNVSGTVCCGIFKKCTIRF